MFDDDINDLLEMAGGNAGFSDPIDLVYSEVPIAVLLYRKTPTGPELRIPIYKEVEIRIGREESKWYDLGAKEEGSHSLKFSSTSSEHVIDNPHVSKKHFRIYSVIYERDNIQSDLQPLVYCEDLESTNGTFVNDQCIGMLGRERIGHLLCHSDTIEIKPHWRFRFHQPYNSGTLRNQEQQEDLRYLEDSYQVSDRALGKGHYGAVFLAKQVSTSRQLACKIVDLEAAAREMPGSTQFDAAPGTRLVEQVLRREEDRRKVMREINILAKLSHPNIINLKKAFCSDNSLYIFTELAPGGDLFSYIEAHDGNLPDWHSRVIARQIVLAIEYIHSVGVIHRDIKPENVLVMQTDFGGRVVLTDFGFANHIEPGSGRLMSRLGTDGYIAPEINSVESTKEGYTTAADMWSLGVLTACLLTGNALIPIDEMSQLSQIQIAERFLEMNNSDVRHQWQYMPRRALKFLRRLLLLDPARRMTSTQALNHVWFKKPPSEAAAIELAYKRITRFWTRRETGDQVIENLPSRSKATNDDQLSKLGPKFRRKLPDTTMSPYFGLDRHLQHRESPQRRTILENLSESGSLFLTAEAPTKAPCAANMAARRLLDIKSVSGKDLFGYSSNQRESSSGSSKASESQLTPRTALPDVADRSSPPPRGASREDDELSEDERPGGRMATNGKGMNARKRSRQESEDAEVRRMHDDVARKLPKFGSAKAYHDEIKKQKVEKGMASRGQRPRDIGVSMASKG